MMKKIGISTLLALLIMSLAACSGGSSIITIGEIKPSDHSITGEYHSFSGYYFKKVKIKHSETLNVNFSVETEKGELVAKLIDSEGKTIKTLLSGENVTVSKPGKYKLQVEGEKHRGNFTLEWEIE